MPNDKNWFASLDAKMPFNGFVHTADWEYFVPSRPAFPIAYEVIALVLQKHIIADNGFQRASIHNIPIGCVNDFCQKKSEIILKLRTGDICKDCIDLLDGRMSGQEIDHALRLMDSLRVKMLYSQNFRQKSPPSRLEVTADHRILLPDYGDDFEIHLRPLEKVLYLLFLRHEEGILLRDLNQHYEKVYQDYQRISRSDDVDKMRTRIEELLGGRQNYASELISRIRHVFEDIIGNQLAKHYYIKGGNAEPKKIELNRGLVIYNAPR
jgi:hypothetical protein